MSKRKKEIITPKCPQLLLRQKKKFIQSSPIEDLNDDSILNIGTDDIRKDKPKSSQIRSIINSKSLPNVDIIFSQCSIWNRDEDEILLNAVNKYGVEKWALIASELTDRSSKQCKDRWYNYVMNENKNDWESWEDQIIISEHDIIGNKLDKISKKLPGRSDSAIKKRLDLLLNKEHTDHIQSKQYITESCNTILSSLPYQPEIPTTSGYLKLTNDKDSWSPSLLKGSRMKSISNKLLQEEIRRNDMLSNLTVPQNEIEQIIQSTDVLTINTLLNDDYNSRYTISPSLTDINRPRTLLDFNMANGLSISPPASPNNLSPRSVSPASMNSIYPIANHSESPKYNAFNHHFSHDLHGELKNGPLAGFWRDMDEDDILGMNNSYFNDYYTFPNTMANKFGSPYGSTDSNDSSTYANELNQTWKMYKDGLLSEDEMKQRKIDIVKSISPRIRNRNSDSSF